MLNNSFYKVYNLKYLLSTQITKKKKIVYLVGDSDTDLVGEERTGFGGYPGNSFCLLAYLLL